MNPILRRLPRWLNRLYAKALGYFWIPCPMCKRETGGHEFSDEALLDADSTTVIIGERGRIMGKNGRLVCWRCADLVYVLNISRMVDIQVRALREWIRKEEAHQ